MLAGDVLWSGAILMLAGDVLWSGAYSIEASPETTNSAFCLACMKKNMLLLMEYVFLRNRILQLPASVLLAFDLRTGLLVSLPFCDCSGRLY